VRGHCLCCRGFKSSQVKQHSNLDERLPTSGVTGRTSLIEGLHVVSLIAHCVSVRPHLYFLSLSVLHTYTVSLSLSVLHTYTVSLSLFSTLILSLSLCSPHLYCLSLVCQPLSLHRTDETAPIATLCWCHHYMPPDV